MIPHFFLRPRPLLAGVFPALLLAFSHASGAPAQEAYFKASNAGVLQEFGWSMAMDGDTLVVAAPKEWSSAKGVNGNQADMSASQAGAVYVFVKQDGVWSQQAYLKASDTAAGALFGSAVALEGDWLAVGRPGSVYLFARQEGVWSQQAQLFGGNAAGPLTSAFGAAVALKGDTLVVGDPNDASAAGGIDGDEFDESATSAGAASIFVRQGEEWVRQAYLKALHPDAGDQFGGSVSLSGDTVVVGAAKEASSATGIDGGAADNSAAGAGAAFVFVRNTAGQWSQQAYLKASNAEAGDAFGQRVVVAGGTVLVTAPGEDSAGDPADNSLLQAGAAYVFVGDGGSWSQQAYLKAPHPGADDGYGQAAALEGNLAVVTAPRHDSAASGVNGDDTNKAKPNAGAAYVSLRSGASWTHHAYLKASNPREYTEFGANGVTISGFSVAVGSAKEWSSSKGINGAQFDWTVTYAGAAYLFTGLENATITGSRREGNSYGIDFTAVPGVTGWKVKGSADLQSFSQDLTAGSTIGEISPGRYQVLVPLPGDAPARYFMRIEY